MLTNLQILLDSLALPSIQFTKMLHSVYKEYGGNQGWYGMELSESDAQSVLDSTSKIIYSPHATDYAKYNAFRSLKMVLSNREIFRRIFEPLLSIFRYGIIHKSGHLRIGAVRILEEMEYMVYSDTSIAFSRKRMTKKMREDNVYYWPLFLDLLFEIQRMHNAYENEHEASLDMEDLRGRDEGYIPYSGDTKDKQLKAFRMALEVYNTSYIDEKLAEFWYVASGDGDTDMGEDRNANANQSFSIPTRKQSEEALQFFLLLSWLLVTVEKIKDHIYNAPSDTKEVTRYYFGYIFSLLEDHNIEPSQEIMDIFQNCWNTFPHKVLGGKSPSEIFGK